MEGLLSFLIFGGLFFLMMRYGCGAHMAHGGHGGHGSHSTGNEEKHTDPVCGMDVDMSQGYGKMHEGQLYRFCSRSCLDRFEADPGKYLNQPAETSGGGS
jgi:YHS domain-containing protein